MTHRLDDPADIRSTTVTTLAPAEGNSAERSFDRGTLAWAAPIVPWLWFVVRGVHSLMDWIAIGLPVLTIGAGIIALYGTVTRASLRWLLVFVSLVLFFVVAVVGPWRPTNGSAPTSSIRVATVNTGLYWFSDNDVGFLVNQEQPNIVIGVELTEAHDTELRSRFPNAEAEILPLERQQQNEIALQPDGESYRRNGLPSIGVYANVEMERLDDPLDGVIDGGLPGFRLQIETDSGPMIVYALHIPRPIGGDGPYEVSVSEHVAMVEAIADAVDAETLPTLVAGDLNAVDRGQSYRRLTENLVDGMRHDGWAVPTADRPLPFSLLFARIDHLLMSPSLCTDNTASINTRYADHRPLVADIGPC